MVHPYDQRFPCRIPEPTLAQLAGNIVGTVFPTGTPKLVFFTQVSKVPDRDTWAQRIALNTISSLALDDPALLAVVQTKGPNAPECRAAFSQQWCGFLMAAGYPTPAVDFDNSVLFAFIILERLILIEQVQSKRNGKGGGWGLISAVVSQLVPWAQTFEISTLRTTATNETAARLFERQGFREVTSDLLVDPVKYRKLLVMDVPSRSAGTS